MCGVFEHFLHILYSIHAWDVHIICVFKETWNLMGNREYYHITMWKL